MLANTYGFDVRGDGLIHFSSALDFPGGGLKMHVASTLDFPGGGVVHFASALDSLVGGLKMHFCVGVGCTG